MSPDREQNAENEYSNERVRRKRLMADLRHISEPDLAEAIVDCGAAQLAEALLADSEVCDYLADWYFGRDTVIGRESSDD